MYFTNPKNSFRQGKLFKDAYFKVYTNLIIIGY